MSEERVQRRLAAILAADIVGYSRLMGEDEVGTLARLRGLRRDLVDPRVTDHNGRIVKTTGDGVLVEFTSVVEAVACAVAVQREMARHNASVPTDQRMAFRVGINLGDVIVEDDDIHGDGVNVAARLEALAEPGGICVSAIVHDLVRGRLDCSFDDIGEPELKNIARKIRVYRARFDGLRHQPLARVHTPSIGVPAPQNVRAPPRFSIVVLPFVSLSSDPNQEYFADAITDDLTTDLSRIPNSFVIARTTAFTYRGTRLDVRQIGKDLGVRYVLEGSVRRDGDRVRVNVQLIDAESGAHIWADRFDADLINLTEAQDAIVSRLGRSLNLQVMEAVGRQIDKDNIFNLEANDLVMRGWSFSNRSNSDQNLSAAVECFESALRIDAESVDAKIGLATVLTEMVTNGRKPLVNDGDQGLARCERLLLEAAERDINRPKLAEAIGVLHRLQNRLTDSRIEFERAIALNHNNFIAAHQLGMTLLLLGEPEQSLPLFFKRLQLEPKSPNVFFANWWIACAYLLMARVDEAVDFYRKARAGNPAFPPTLLYLAAALALRGDIEEAGTALSEWLQMRPQLDSIAKLKANPIWQTGTAKYFDLRERTVIVGLRRAGMPEI
jgi:adenylate cyclase